MGRVLLLILGIALTVYCVVDCVQSDGSRVRNLPKAAWVIIVLLIPVIGPVAWLVAGRERAMPPRSAPKAPPRPVAPDDDPRFLAGLDRTNAERRKIAEWERELERTDEAPAEANDTDADGGTGESDEPRTTLN